MYKTKAILLNHGYTKGNVIEYELEARKWDPSITDPTFYTPVGSMVRKLTSQDRVAIQNQRQLFDFMDGKDTGIELPVSRKKGVDIAELSTEIREQTKSAKKRINEDIEKAMALKKKEMTGQEEPLDNVKLE